MSASTAALALIRAPSTPSSPRTKFRSSGANTSRSTRTISRIVSRVLRPRSHSPMHRPSRPGADSPHGILRFRGDPEKGAEAGVASCARSVTHLRDALPHVLVGSLAPAAEAAKYAADLRCETLSLAWSLTDGWRSSPAVGPASAARYACGSPGPARPR